MLEQKSDVSRTVKRLYDRMMSKATGKWAFIGVLIGIVSGLGSIALYLSITYVTKYLLTGLTGFAPPRSGLISGTTPYVLSPHIDYLLFPVSLIIGGLLVALLLNKTAPEAKGHGTDAAISAFHENDGKIRRRIPLVKTVASALTIGSGGSGGREGPTAQIAAGFGSFLADAFHLDSHDRRIAMASGIGAGIGSIFLAPLGGAILSTEVLYKRDFETEALIPSIIASVVGYSIFGYYTGFKTLFSIPPDQILGFTHPSALIAYIFVGIAAGLGALFYIKTFYGVTAIFQRLKRVSPYLKPAIGGGIVGVIAIFFPQILGLGYGWLQQVLDGNLALFGNGTYELIAIFVVLFALKAVATSLSIGSEGSGGVFAPGLVLGAFLGAALSFPVRFFFPFLSFDEIVLVTMIALFGGASKAPIAIIIMGTEMTDSFALFIPLMLATVISYFITGNMSIYRSQVTDRSKSGAHADEYRKPIMEDIKIYTAMKKNYLRISMGDSIAAGLNKLRESKTKSLVVEDNGLMVGYLSLENIPSDVNYNDKVETVMQTKNLPILYPNDNLHTALTKIMNESSGKLIILESPESKKVEGSLSLQEITEAYNKEIRTIKEAQRKAQRDDI